MINVETHAAHCPMASTLRICPDTEALDLVPSLSSIVTSPPSLKTLGLGVFTIVVLGAINWTVASVRTDLPDTLCANNSDTSYGRRAPLIF